MSYDFSKRNKKNGVRPADLNTDSFEYSHIRECAGEDVAVKGFFFTKGKKGRQVVVITDDCFLNMPGWAVEEFEDLQEDPDAVEAILNGELVLTNIREATTKDGYNTVYFDYANAEPKKGKK